ncbi:MAG: N-succinylglutamate 5-semialdehyde dehydrogenase [Phycisphaeraceae bacterium]|nr:MAG: N-succinylglutamate 5-semialdehyde dehydrogenase [Phycisphaeraceae bacterium]
MTHPTLTRAPADLVAGEWIDLAPANGNAGLESTNPSRPGEVLWSGTPMPAHVDRAVAAARAALPEWSSWDLDRRVGVLRRFQELAKDRAPAIAELICDETGKALWDCKGEAGLLAAKVDITLEPGEHSGISRVSGFEFAMGETKRASCTFRPHGVMAVVGPFNFPAHLPNGHIVPALATGNTIVFKPSDKTPAVGQALAELFQQALDDACAPAGVFNLVQGAVETSKKLVAHPDADGVLFTGSWPVGRAILGANLDYPGKLVALEMGGNNAAVVMGDADLTQAVTECVRCAFITTGQRCTCTRRLIVHEAVADKVIGAVCKAASALVVDDPRAEPVFMGPIVSEQSRDAVFAFQTKLAKAGGEVLVESTPVPGREGWYLTPSVVKVERFTLGCDDAGCDEEVFGPLLRISVVSSLDDAIAQANATKYGLAASIFTKDAASIERFRREARAGCVNVNCGTAGASSKLPFGGLGWSGNHRPAGAFSLDYCAYPVAGMLEGGDAAVIAQGMTVDPDWVA